MSLGELLEALKQILLVMDRLDTLSKQVTLLANTCSELDRRLTRIEAKTETVFDLDRRLTKIEVMFDFLERFAVSSRRSLIEKTGK